MLDNLESIHLAARGRATDLRQQAATRNITRAVKAEKRRCNVEQKLVALKAQVEQLETRASSAWENQRRQTVLETLIRARGA